MKFDIRREDGTVEVVLSGRIGVAEAVELRHRLFPELTAGVPGVSLRMDEVTDLDSSGLGLLLALRNLCADIGATFEIRNAGAWLEPKLDAIGLLSH
ncbi:STAS domain-containing protein [Cohnella rhizosphaerae]|uniref:STAS domain-containing protein n=1 Tax=Cohnella rhizosphaerae TaxID=1457232 RepID=A0A9X4KSC3_9BACL|nr:STAS domain-containing protein [Cohnella rhizosphaerae]MDG0809341.1 STAS domain-containing protein [Cohnella rhizosphaerae]